MFANRYAVPELERLAREGRVVAFDAETTGLTPRDEICQLAAVEYVAGKEARTFMRIYTMKYSDQLLSHVRLFVTP